MTYWRLHYHLIFATHERQPTLTGESVQIFYTVLHKKAKELDLRIHAAGNVQDHVHIVLSIPPKISIADCVKHIKGASAYAINHHTGSDAQFKWQAGYGALTIGERSLETVMAYASRQQEHHQARRTIAIYEQFDEPAGDGAGPDGAGDESPAQYVETG